MSLTKITVMYSDDLAVDYDSLGSGITEGLSPRLWIDLVDGRLYILLDKIVSYFIHHEISQQMDN